MRTPVVRTLAKEFCKNPNIDKFLNSLPHKYQEENNLHSFIICEIKDYEECIIKINEFLPFVDNWAVCDSMRPKSFKNNKDKLIIDIYEWLNSEDEYTIRFGIEMLMTHFLDGDFKEEYLETVSLIKREEYYIKMMISWLFATALAKQYDKTISYLERGKLSSWVHNKTIQKAIESYRLSKEQKDYLRKLKVL